MKRLHIITWIIVVLCGMLLQNISCSVNFALQKPTKQSSSRIDWDNSYIAVDGKTNDCTHTKIQMSGWHWWQVDLQDTYIVKYINVTNECCGNELHGFSIEVSEEDPSTLPGFPGATNAAVCMTREDTVPTPGPVTRECKQPVKGRYVRLVEESRMYFPLKICEFEVYGDFLKPKNIALGKPATQSSTFVSNQFPRPHSDASKAVDGNLNSNFNEGSCSHTLKGHNWHWWHVDLQDNYTISAVRITNRNDCCGDILFDFAIEVSEEEPSTLPGFPKTTNAAVCLTQKDEIPSSEPFILECDQPVKGRYLRIVKKNLPLTLCEVEVFGNISRPTNIALGKPATQSSTLETERYPKPFSYAFKAVDGNTNSHYQAGSCSHTLPGIDWHWWQVDLQDMYIISAVRISNRQDCCSERLHGFNIEISEEEPSTLPGFPKPTNAAVCLKRQYPIPNSGPFKLECDQPVKGRYLRIVWNVKKETPLTLCEVEVFGSLIKPTEAPVEELMNGGHFHWRFIYIAISGSMEKLDSSTLTRLMIDCARQRRGDRSDLYRNLYMHIDRQTGTCRFLDNITNLSVIPSSNWIIYKPE